MQANDNAVSLVTGNSISVDFGDFDREWNEMIDATIAHLRWGWLAFQEPVNNYNHPLHPQVTDIAHMIATGEPLFGRAA